VEVVVESSMLCSYEWCVRCCLTCCCHT